MCVCRAADACARPTHALSQPHTHILRPDPHTGIAADTATSAGANAATDAATDTAADTAADTEGDAAEGDAAESLADQPAEPIEAVVFDLDDTLYPLSSGFTGVWVCRWVGVCACVCAHKCKGDG